MSHRIEQRFSELKRAGRKGLIPFITAGDPLPEAMVAIMHALVSGDGGVVGPLLGGALAQAPAVLTVGACAVLILGWLPRWAALAWAVFAFVLLQSYLGGLLSLPDAVAGISPFWHLPMVPTETFTATPGVVLSVVAAVLSALGLLGLRSRDIT